MVKTAYIFFGKSGSGKGTQANLLINHLKQDKKPVLYIETGARLRQFINEQNFVSELTKKTLLSGGLLPEFLPITVWSQALTQEYTGNELLILDGVSRRIPEAPILKNALQYIGIQRMLVINIVVSDQWSTDRLIGRGRDDDNHQEIQKRLNWFSENTAPVLDYFKKEHVFEIIDINGEQTIEQVHNEIIKKI